MRARHGRTPNTTGVPTRINEPRPCHPTPSRRVARFRQLAVNTVASSKTDHVFQFGVQHRPEVSAPPDEREPKETGPRAPSPEPTADPLALAVDLLSGSPQVQIEPPPTEPPPTHERSEELFSAVGDGDAAALGALLEAGVPATCVDDDGCTPLIHAAEGESACVELLLPRSAGHINRRSADGTTALIAAVKYEDVTIVNLLLGAGADPQAADDSGKSATDYAHEANDEGLLRAIRGEATPRSARRASRAGQDKPLARRQSVSDSTLEGFTAMHTEANTSFRKGSQRGSRRASFADNPVASEIAAAARPVEPPPTEPPPTHERSEELFSAVGDGDAAALGALLEAGVPATCVDDDGCTPLIHAAEGESACVELLLPRSAGHINRRSADGTTALIAAVKYEDVTIVNLLLGAGADPQAADDSGKSATDYAHEANDEGLLRAIRGEATPRSARRASRAGQDKPLARRQSVSDNTLEGFTAMHTEANTKGSTKGSRRASFVKESSD